MKRGQSEDSGGRENNKKKTKKQMVPMKFKDRKPASETRAQNGDVKIKKINRIIVDPSQKTNGSVRTLQEALDLATSDTVIKLTEGTYNTHIHINKPGLKIEPRDKDKICYFIYSEGPIVSTDLKPGETCILNRLILSHNGANSGERVQAKM